MPERVGKKENYANTIQIHRVRRAAREKVDRALLDPEATAKWQGA